MDSKLSYSATDNCNGPLNVTVAVYSNEIEDFNAQQMALFYQNSNGVSGKADLYLAAGVCSTIQNGQCVKDPAALDARLYTAVVTATDEAGNTASAECRLRTIPKGNTKKKAIDTSASTQRFLLTSYSSVLS